LFGAKIEAKARAKPKEGLGTCSSLFRPFLAKQISVEMAKKNGNNRVHFHGTPKKIILAVTYFFQYYTQVLNKS
jgi:hypothetical protein